MAQHFPALAPAPSGTKLENPIPIIGTKYCALYPVDLSVVKKVMTISNGNFVVSDINGTVIFKVKGKLMSIQDQRILLDGAGNRIVTLREKIMSAHHTWYAYRGVSKEPNDLLFTVKRSSMIQLKANLHVFLANNTKEEVCDFKVVGSWFERTCVVYAGDSPNIVARMSKKTTVEIILIEKDNFSVGVLPAPYGAG
ncbi:hypothetical protein I3760_10G162300 [Carya illinoinensis]|uniref:Protein LURP-one-related 15 n=1 Tax=Carya illinoinensis TaxID=32201 RepID=A0A922D341_CARIL|nr:hypothetical protein I3760_10G162300 [Carya illinoinensis]KAG6620961.1 hypothetical protein I3842_Q049000 [Carya illinoinensis]